MEKFRLQLFREFEGNMVFLHYDTLDELIEHLKNYNERHKTYLKACKEFVEVEGLFAKEPSETM